MGEVNSRTRRVAPEDWGKVMIEEILFRAARDVGESRDAGGGLTVTMVFTVTANRERRAIEISTAGAVEPIIVTQVEL
jgi:hypothetical protein